jgi:NarL family two-component system response regulator LiaR
MYDAVRYIPDCASVEVWIKMWILWKQRRKYFFERNLDYVTRILIADDSPLIRKSLRTLFAQQPDWTICGEAENGCDAIDKAKKVLPDLIIIDLVMPVLNGIEATRLLKMMMPATPILMFTTFTDTHLKEVALAAGVHAVIDKNEGGTTLIDSIRTLLTGLPPATAA